MGLALCVALARGAFSAFAVRWSCRVGNDPTPDSCPSVIAFRCSLPGAPEAIRLGLVGVAIDHQHRNTPDLDLPYHAENDSGVCVSNCLNEEDTIAEPSLHVEHRLL